MKKRTIAFLLVCSMVLTLGAAGAFAAEEPEDASSEEQALSDDLYSFQMKIDGQLYQFPMSYDEFTALGWVYKGDEAEELRPNSYDSVRFMWGEVTYPGEVRPKVSVPLFNLGLNTVGYSECSVGGINIGGLSDELDCRVELPNGIEFGVSTLDDIKAAYGTPSNEHEYESDVTLWYNFDSYCSWSFGVSGDSGVLDEVEVENLVADEESKTAQAASVSKEPTPEVLAYEAPTELGNDPLSFVAEIAGDLYQFPAPVAAFMENGWKLDERKSDNVIAGKSTGYAYLVKDNQGGKLLVRNYSADAAAVENCFVTQFSGTTDGSYVFSGASVPVKIPSGVSTGMTRDEAFELLLSDDVPGTVYVSENDYYTYWNFYLDLERTFENGVEIQVDKETDTVTTITIDREPESLTE